MTIENIQRAQAIAKRFLDCMEPVLKQYEKGDFFTWKGNKHTAQLRRASMDLTRALAEMRKP